MKYFKFLYVKFTNGKLSFLLFYFLILFYFHFIFLFFDFLEYRVMVGSQDTENEVEGSRIDDVIQQYKHYMLASCSTHGHLG